MPVSIRNLEWNNHNAQRAYPIAQDVSRWDESESFRIPNDFITGMTLPIHWGLSVEPAKFFISKIASYATGFSVTIGYAADDGDIDIASALIARSAHTPYQVYNLGGIGDFADSRGFITIGQFDGIDLQPSGMFEFTLETARLEVDVIRPHIRGVMSLQIQNGSELSDQLTGRIRLAAGTNTRLRVDNLSGDPIVYVDAIDGEGLTDSCVCTTDRDPILTINGIGPDSDGNIQILGNACLEVSESGNILEFKDVCSEPCCGCEELEKITQALEAFGERATTLENFLVNLEARVTQMDMVVLGSRLGDRGCSTECA